MSRDHPQASAGDAGSDHHPHHHPHGNERAVGLAALLTGGFMLAEVLGGLLTGSLALLADAGHMLTDFAALGLSWFGFRLARRPADWTRTYGFDRFSVLAAFVNGLALFVIAGWIAVEAAVRLRDPVEVLGGPMMAVAVAGLVVNLLSFRILSGADSANLNVRAAALHVLGDLLGSLGAIAASLVIVATGWMPIDPILSVLVSVLILRSAWVVVRDSARVLLEATPRGFDAEAALAALGRVEGVGRVGHLHAWSITEERPMATLEADLAPGADAEAVRRALRAVLDEDFGIAHATIEIRTGARGA